MKSEGREVLRKNKLLTHWAKAFLDSPPICPHAVPAWTPPFKKWHVLPSWWMSFLLHMFCPITFFVTVVKDNGIFFHWVNHLFSIYNILAFFSVLKLWRRANKKCKVPAFVEFVFSWWKNNFFKQTKFTS